MRKVLISLIGCLLLVSLSSLIFMFNFRMIVWTPEKMKALARESGLYELVAGTLKDSLVQNGSVDLKNGQTLEIINKSINSTSIGKIGDSLADQIFAVSRGEGRNITIDFADLVKQLQGQIPNAPAELTLGEEFPMKRSFDLKQNLGLDLIKNVNNSIYASLITSLVFIAMILLLATPVSRKFSALGKVLFVFSLSILVTTVSLYLASNYITGLAESNSGDPKLAKGVAQLITTLIDKNKIYYVIETIISFILSIGLIVIGRFMKSANPTEPNGKAQQTSTWLSGLAKPEQPNK